MNYIDLGLVLFVLIFTIILYRMSFWMLLKSQIAFILAILIASLFLNTFLATLASFGWRENLYTPLFSYPLLVVIVWGALLTFLSIILPRVKLGASRLPSIILSLIFSLILYIFLLLIVPLFVPSVSFLSQVKSSFVYQNLKQITLVSNFKDKYLNNLLDPILISKNDNRAITLNFKIVNVTPDNQSSREIFNDINSSRAQNGAAPLEHDTSLDTLALNYAYQIAQTKYFSHYSADGVSPEERAKNANIKFNYLGENLALATNSLSAHQAMMASPDHRANIEATIFKKIGIATLNLSPVEKVFVEEFSN